MKIQIDGTVEVDVTHNAPVASELLELDAFDYAADDIENCAFRLSKPIPRLKIAMLVVGTRGDVQPFIAFAQKLQASMLMQLSDILEAFECSVYCVNVL